MSNSDESMTEGGRPRAGLLYHLIDLCSFHDTDVLDQAKTIDEIRNIIWAAIQRMPEQNVAALMQLHDSWEQADRERFEAWFSAVRASQTPVPDHFR